MRIINNTSSKGLNTFGIDVNISTLIEIQNIEDLSSIERADSFKVLGGGSNVLLTGDLYQKLYSINLKGIHIVLDRDDYVLVKVGAGEIWHETVLWALDNKLGGIENLSLIPGKCGAAPIQNIGAYGVELKDVIHTVYAYDIDKKVELALHHSECGFGYRTSNFKTIWKDRFIITSIVLRLTKDPHHSINTSYGDILSLLGANGILLPSIHDISRAVIQIRQSKLPDPSHIGNAGSFFKNPIIHKEKHDLLKTRFPNLVSYAYNHEFKLAAGWLIDQCGWKGVTESNGVGTYKNQALVIVNQGHASGQQIWDFAQKIIQSVEEKFDVTLEPEVNIWN